MCATTTGELLNLHLIQEGFFRAAIRRRVAEYRTHFADRLAAVYVRGSVHRNEAVPGISDLDLMVFITDAFDEADEYWWRETWERMKPQEPPGTGGFPRAHSVSDYPRGTSLGADERLQQRLRECRLYLHYDATLVWGSDLTADLDVQPPDLTWARWYYRFPRDLALYAAGVARENRTDFELPDELPLRLRKLARLAILGGACFLMARGEFRSFRGADVLPALERFFPQADSFLQVTRERYIQPGNPMPDEVTDYLSQLVSWMDLVGAQFTAP